MIHVRKVEHEYFEALRTGRKRFELRKEKVDEEPFSAGDFLALNEWTKSETTQISADGRLYAELPCGHYTGRCLLFEILYVLRGHELQLTGTVILSLSLRPLSPDDVAAIR